MKAGPVEIGTLLQNRNRYCVPIYQRHYVWNREKQWEPFWQDIRTKAIERLAGRERRFSHFMGAVVLESRAKPSVKQVPSFQVVDGQQRLTTFQLFLTAARHYAQSIGHETTVGNITRYVLNSDPQLMEDADIEIYKVWPTESNRKLFVDIIASKDRAALKKAYADQWYANSSRDQVKEYNTTPSMLRAYGYFYDRIKHSVETDDLHDDLVEAPEVENTTAPASEDGIPKELKLDAIWQSLLEEFKVVEIVLDEGDDAQVIFETLNDRGEPLLAADLVRNNIFQRADARGENAEVLFKRHWKPFEAPFWSVMEKQGRYKKQRIEFFIANFIAGKMAGDVTISKLFSEYKAFLRPARNSTVPRYANVQAEIQDLEAYGKVYRDIVERTSGSPLAVFSARLRPWDVTTINPLLLRLWSSNMGETEKQASLDLVLSLIVRRAVCGLTSKNYNNLFLMVVADMDKKGWSYENLRAYLLSLTSESGRFPQDAEFENAIGTKPLYTTLGPARLRTLLSEIELAKRGKKQEHQSLPETLTVEHILPQQWRQHWPMVSEVQPTEADFNQAFFAVLENESAVGQIVRRNRIKHTLGNLTLVTQSFNSGVSNLAFSKKRQEFEDQSILMLTKDFVRKDRWSEDEISDRGKILYAFSRQIWAAP
ncbi:DUF262 domain-containing protein [Mesorhizobium sp. M6A.T.Cr.TU.017.01.1.1]|uniref:DUF262 domain-containing protein n=1 Tax=Mesorhizobium sp. M6A.T.Cr.TU.017.01.1.1 TaxID=2496774 RepID=UPI000FD5A1EB|nr:DUF262 domain-containing protein [Mesorhizobium sp. M6A.T.Cr.TU.017.01.1.1]RUU97102.1 DUF262 domain-containing protein [Mesorhizobium sp. M6A.T.Cr.TU.017.01.1.1]